MDYFNEFWLGFITAKFVQRCVDEALQTCHGCRDKKVSPLLHMCHQLGLENKITYHMETVRGNMIPEIPSLYEEFKSKVDSSSMDKDAYVTNARFFLISATPQSLYYGRYLNETNDAFIHHQPIREEPVKVAGKKGIKRRKKQKELISQNVPGTDVAEDVQGNLC